MHPSGVWTVAVGWTSSRPIVPDEHTSFVQVWAAEEVEATLLAAQIVAVRVHDTCGGTVAGCVMPTRTTILDLLM